jgi:hypothetical protein
MKLTSARALKHELHAAAAAAVHINALEAKPHLAVGIAPTEATDDYRIAIRIREATPTALARAEQISVHAAGEVDMRVIGRVAVQPAAALVAPKRLRIGVSIGHFAITAGTLGCFARRADGTTGIVSNNHVLAREDLGVAGDDVVQPGPIDGGARPADTIATLFVPYPKLRPGRPTLDCAFAVIDPQRVQFDPSDLEGGGVLDNTVAEATEQLLVEKIGRTTGRTKGRISAFNVDDLTVDYETGSVTFDDQIEIESLDGSPFSSPGDSGSLIFDQSFRPVALLFAGSDSGGTFGSGLTFANPFQSVLDALGVGLLT